MGLLPLVLGSKRRRLSCKRGSVRPRPCRLVAWDAVDEAAAVRVEADAAFGRRFEAFFVVVVGSTGTGGGGLTGGVGDGGGRPAPGGRAWQMLPARS